MPQVIVQATPNVIIKNPEILLKQINSTLWESELFAKPQAIKSRILDVDTFLVGTDDHQQSEGFVYLQVRLMPGRSQEVRDALADNLLACLQQVLHQQQSGRVTIQYCVEVIELSQVYKKVSV